jgi:hypothetical protein
MKWITRSYVDRVACPWLITRFIGNEAEFSFVPVPPVIAVLPGSYGKPESPV